MDSFQMQPQNQMPLNSFGPPVQPYLPPKDHKYRPLIIALCVCLGAAVLGGCWLAHINSAAYRIKKGLSNLAKEAEELQNPLLARMGTEELRQMILTDGNQVDTRLNVTFDSFLGEVTLGVDTDYAMDRKKKEMSSSTAISMMNYELAHVELYGDEEVFCFSIPELFLEDMYVENENVLSQYNDSIWADDTLFGRAEGDDFSIDLFSDCGLYTASTAEGNAFYNRYEWQIENCRRHMTIEKAGNGLYRVSCEGTYVNELIRQILYDYIDAATVGRDEAMWLLSYFNVISTPDDVNLLFEISAGNRIESIRLEKPLFLCGNALSLDGELAFLGEKNSLEKVQGRLEIKRKERAMGTSWVSDVDLVWQMVQSLEQDEYCMETDIRCSVSNEDIDSQMGMKWELECDGRRNSFDVAGSMREFEKELSLEASGSLSNIEKGEGFDLELDEFLLYSDGEEVLQIKGDIALEPLTKRVKQNAHPKTAFFELSVLEWSDIGEQLSRSYGYLFDAIPEFFW